MAGYSPHSDPALAPSPNLFLRDPDPNSDPMSSAPAPTRRPYRIFETPVESPDKWEEAGLRVVQVRLRNFEIE